MDAQKAVVDMDAAAAALLKAQERFILDLAQAMEPFGVCLKSVQGLRICLDDIAQNWAREHIPFWDLRAYPQILASELELDRDESKAIVPHLKGKLTV